MREAIVEYLRLQLAHLSREENHYLVAGVVWAAARIRGDEPVEENFEPAPTESLDEFLERWGR